METPKPKSKRKLILAITGGLLVLCVILVIASNSGGKKSDSGQVARATTAATSAPAVQEATEVKATATPTPTETPEPTETPMPAGLSRDNPAALGTPVLADDGIGLTIVDVQQGAPAWAAIKGFNMFNDEPKAGMEYVVVTVECKFSGDTNKTQAISGYYFRLVGERGQIYDDAGQVVEPEISMELFGGGSGRGAVAFAVAQGEKDLVLIYSGSGTNARFLALE